MSWESPPGRPGRLQTSLGCADATGSTLQPRDQRMLPGLP